MKSSQQSGERRRAPRVLAVDDQRANAVCLQFVLEPEGYEVVVETSGRRALELCLTTSFDLILLDVMMPDMDGVEVAKALRHDPRTGTIPIVFVTAAPDAVTSLPFQGGDIDVISKPVDLDVLRATAARLVLVPPLRAASRREL